MNIVRLVMGCVGLQLLGLGLGALLFKRGQQGQQRAAPAVERWGLALALGIAANSWLLFAWSWLGGELGATISWTLCGAGFAAGGPALWRGRRDRAATAERGGGGADPETALCRCCQVVVSIVLLMCLFQTLLTPARFWDERAIFAIKGKVLFEDRTIFSESLADADFVQGHPRYPLLIPLAEQHVYALLGRIDDRWSKVMFPLLLAALVLTFAGVLTRQIGPARGWLFAVVLATTPVLFPFELGFLSGQADAPVAAFHGLAVLYAWDELRRRRQGGAASPVRVPWVLAGCLSAAAAFTKDEGIAFGLVGVVALCGAWLAGARQQRQSETAALPRANDGFRFQALLAALGALALTGAVLLGPWFAHRRGLPMTTEMNYFGRMTPDLLPGRLDAIGWLLPHLAARMFREWNAWGLQWWLVAAALLSAPRRALRAEQLFVLLEIAGGLAALIVAGLLAPADLQDHIGGSSHRYLMQLAPAAILFVAGQWGGEGDRPSAPTA